MMAAIQRLLGLAQYLSKFLPHLSDITKPLRELTQRHQVDMGISTTERIGNIEEGCLKHTYPPVLQSTRGSHIAV